MDFSFVINFTYLLSCCFGGIVKRDISDQNEVPHHHHHLHSYGYYSSLQDQDQSYHGPYRGNPLDGGVCVSLRRIFILMVDSGVSQCKPLPKTIKGKTEIRIILMNLISLPNVQVQFVIFVSMLDPRLLGTV